MKLPSLRSVVGAWIGPLVLGAAVFGIAIALFGPFDRLAAIIQRKPLFVQFPGDIGTLELDKEYSAKIVLENLESSSVDVLGLTPSVVTRKSLSVRLDELRPSEVGSGPFRTKPDTIKTVCDTTLVADVSRPTQPASQSSHLSDNC